MSVDLITDEVVTAEERLLLLMSLAELSEDELLDAHSFAGRVRDWAEFVTLAEDNATVPLVQRNLERANLFSLLPAPLRQRLSARSEAIAAANQARLAVARRFLARFEEAGIPVVILKGVLFAETVYGDPNYKRMNDIDILVRKQDLDAIFAIYESLGFFSAAEVFGGEPRKQEKFSHHAPPFFSRDLACMIGTHWGLITPLSPLTIDYDGIWDRVQPHDFYGIQVLGMCPEDNLHHLCVHLPYYKTGVRELADLYNLVRHTGDAFDWALFRDSMRRAGSQDWVYHALANRLVPIPAVGALLAELRDQVSSGIKRDTARKTRRLARLLRSRTVHLSKIEKLFTEVNSTSEPGEKRRAFVECAGSVPHRGGGALGGGDHLRALVLDRLELPDRAAELFADLGIRRGGVGGPAGDADGLGREQGGDDGPARRLGQVRQQSVAADLNAARPDMGDRAQRVDRAHRFDLQAGRIEHHPFDATADRDRQHQDRRLGGRGHRTGLTADDQFAVALLFGGQARLQRIGADQIPGRQLAERLGVAVVGGDQGAGDHRRDEGSRHRAVAELRDHDRQLQQPEALTVDRLGQVYAVQALLGGGPPVRRRVGDRGFERFVQDLCRCDPRHQRLHRICEIVVLGDDRDGHGRWASLVSADARLHR